MHQQLCEFSLQAANIAGIEILNTKGDWLFGLQSGDNPVSVGESILQGDVKNKETGNKTGLIIDNSRAVQEMEMRMRTMGIAF